MKKRMKKVMAILTVVSLSVSLFGCSGSGGKDGQPAELSDSESREEGAADAAKEDGGKPEALPGSDEMNGLTLPLTDKPEELSILTVFNSTMISDPNDIEGVKLMEERTGVHVNWTTAGNTEMIEKFSTVLASGNLPDIIFGSGTNVYPGGVEKGIEEGVLLDMDELIREYMPNYMALLSQNEAAMKGALSDDGKMHYLRSIYGSDTAVQTGSVGYGLAYRADILEDMGLDVPTTIDGWHEVLQKCRDAGMSAPMTLESDGGSGLSMAWGVNTDWAASYWQMDGEKIAYGPALDGFGEYVETMRQWYAEGLIDPNFTNGNMIISQDYTNIQTNQTMLFAIWFGFMTGSWMNDTGAVDLPGINIQAVGLPTLKEGDEPVKCTGDSPAFSELYITTSCKDPVLAAKWLDYQYSREGSILNWYGIEGLTYTLDADGIPQYTDLILKNEDNLTPAQALQKYALNGGGGAEIGFRNFSAENKIAAALSSTGTTPQIEASAIWDEPAKTIAIPGTMTMTSEEGEEVNRYMTDIKTLTQEYMVNYIMGIDNTPFEDFRQTLYDYGLQKVLDIYQAAYDRYQAR